MCQEQKKTWKNLRKRKGHYLRCRGENCPEQVSAFEKDYRTLVNYRKQGEIVLAALQGRSGIPEKEGLFSLGMALIIPWLWLEQKACWLKYSKGILGSFIEGGTSESLGIDREMESLKHSIINEVRNLISSLRIREKVLQENLNKSEAKIQNLSSTEKELFGLERLWR